MQKFQFTRKQSLKLDYADTITPKKVCDRYGKATFIQVEILSALGFKSFRTAKIIVSGIEVMHMIKKKQTHQRVTSAQNQKAFIHKLFGLAS